MVSRESSSRFLCFPRFPGRQGSETRDVMTSLKRIESKRRYKAVLIGLFLFVRLMQVVQEACPVRVVFFDASLSEVGCSMMMSHFGIGGQNAFEGLGRLGGLEFSQPDLVLVALAPLPQLRGDAVFMSLVTDKIILKDFLYCPRTIGTFGLLRTIPWAAFFNHVSKKFFMGGCHSFLPNRRGRC